MKKTIYIAILLGVLGNAYTRNYQNMENIGEEKRALMVGIHDADQSLEGFKENKEKDEIVQSQRGILQTILGSFTGTLDVSADTINRYLNPSSENWNPFGGVENVANNNFFAQTFKGGIDLVGKRYNIFSSEFNPGGIYDEEKGKCGLIVLHALSVPFLQIPDFIYKSRLAGFGIRKNCIIKKPTARFTANVALMEAFIGLFTGLIPKDVNPVRSWFDFAFVPAIGPVSDSKEELEISLKQIEETIAELVREGVEPSNIVVTGISQGGALTLYTAVHTKYKLGGFVPIIGWLPLRQSEAITKLPTPVNKDTPILHLNGMLDPAVPWATASRGTDQEMKKVFTQYSLKGMVGTAHFTTINPVSIPIIRTWLREKTTIGS